MLLPVEAEASPNVDVSPLSVIRGDIITVSLSGFSQNSAVSIYTAHAVAGNCTYVNPVISGVTGDDGSLTVSLAVTKAAFDENAGYYLVCAQDDIGETAADSFQLGNSAVLSSYYAAIGQEMVATARDFTAANITAGIAVCLSSDTDGSSLVGCVDDGANVGGEDWTYEREPINGDIHYTFTAPDLRSQSGLYLVVKDSDGNNLYTPNPNTDLAGNFGAVRTSIALSESSAEYGDTIEIGASNLVDGESATAYSLAASAPPRSCEFLVNHSDAVRIGTGGTVSGGNASISVAVSDERFSPGDNYICVEDGKGRQTPFDVLDVSHSNVAEVTVTSEPAGGAYGWQEVIRWNVTVPEVSHEPRADSTLILDVGGRIQHATLVSADVDGWEFSFPVLGVDLVDHTGIKLLEQRIIVEEGDENLLVVIPAQEYADHPVDGRIGAPSICHSDPPPHYCLAPLPIGINPPVPPPGDPPETPPGSPPEEPKSPDPPEPPAEDPVTPPSEDPWDPICYPLVPPECYPEYDPWVPPPSDPEPPGSGLPEPPEYVPPVEPPGYKPPEQPPKKG